MSITLSTFQNNSDILYIDTYTIWPNIFSSLPSNHHLHIGRELLVRITGFTPMGCSKVCLGEVNASFDGVSPPRKCVETLRQKTPLKCLSNNAIRTRQL